MFSIEKFGIYLSRLRKRADMTQSELADRLNLTRQAVSRYERGESFPDISVLVKIAEVFAVSTDELINAGGPTAGESAILENVVNGREDILAGEFSDIAGLAPILKPSVLEKLAKNFSKKGIDISEIISLAEYLNDESVTSLLQDAEFEGIDYEILERFLPILSTQSRLNIFENILAGEMDWHFLRVLMRYDDGLLLNSWVEAAVIDGVLPEECLSMLKTSG